MTITEIVLALDPSPGAPPVFDVEVNQLGRGPGVFRTCWGVLEKGSILGPRQQQRLVTMVVFAVDPDAPKQRRRLGLLMHGGAIPGELADEAVYLGTYVSPQVGPVSVYEFPVVEIDEYPPSSSNDLEAVSGEIAGRERGPDVVAALAAVRKETES